MHERIKCRKELKLGRKCSQQQVDVSLHNNAVKKMNGREQDKGKQSTKIQLQTCFFSYLISSINHRGNVETRSKTHLHIVFITGFYYSWVQFKIVLRHTMESPHQSFSNDKELSAEEPSVSLTHITLKINWLLSNQCPPKQK